MGGSTTAPRMAAVVFTDVVGSTARDRRLGPALAEELRRAHFASARAVVESHHGRVVKTLGDGLLCVFESPSRAVDAGVALQHSTAEAGSGHPDPLELRVGISVGEVTFDADGDCFGLAVVEASRLCGSAAAHEILVSQLTQRLCSASLHPFRPLGERTLKGIDAPLEVSRVEWVPPVRGELLNFGDIDSDPRLQVRAAAALDLIGSDPHMRRVRARLLELLDPRPGESMLDLGAGTGDDVFVLRELVGPTGCAVGVDNSQTLVEEARTRALERDAGGVEFVHGDALSLPFEDSTFDGARSDRVFQYLLEPLVAMRELARVVRPGGRIAIAETDWETGVFDSGDDELTGRINRAWTESRPNGRAGHQLYRWAKQAGLVDVTVEGLVQAKTDYDELYATGVLPGLARAGVESGAVTPEEASRWLAGLEHAAAEGVFFRAFTTFVVAARVA